jgi:RNA polymerase sigma factor (sigma-70 family)
MRRPAVTDIRLVATRDMSNQADVVSMGRARVTPRKDIHASGSPVERFEGVYLQNVEDVIGYFARRVREPQTVADLTSETFVRAAEGFSGFDPDRGSSRAWVFGIASHVFASHCDRSATARDAIVRLGGRRQLDDEETEELAGRIDAQRDGSALVANWERLPAPERDAIELVDLAELTPKEAARVLGVSRVAFRQRLSRARSRLRKEHKNER